MEEKHRTNLYTYFTVFTVSLNLFNLGIGTSWSSPVLFKLEDANNTDNPLGHAVSITEASWIGSLNSLGCAIGPIPFGFLAAKIGRKPSLIIVGVLYLTSFMILAFAKLTELYYVGRLLMGFAFAGAFTVNPAYVSEIAHHEDRAKLNLIGVALNFLGVLIPYVVGPYLSIMYFNLFCAIFPVTFLCVFPVFMVESPHYLNSKGDHDSARAALTKLRSKDVEKENDEMIQYINNHKEGSVKELFGSKILLKCLCISIGLSSFQELTGLVALINYTQDIFKAAGSDIPSNVCAIIFSSVQCVLGIGATFVVPRFRFRTLLICSEIGLVTCLTFFGVYFYLKMNLNLDTSKFGWLAIVLMIGIVAGFLYGAGVLPNIITSEIFPTNMRALALSIALSVGSTECFLISKFYLPLNEALGMAGTIWIFAGCCAVGLIFDFLLVPETNGKTFQEIQDIIRKKKTNLVV